MPNPDRSRSWVPRIHALPLLRHAAAREGLMVLADGGYDGAGVGIHTPVRASRRVSYARMHIDNLAYNRLLRGLRAVGERAMAVPVGRCTTLRRISLSPSAVGRIVQAALVLHRYEHSIR
ncbi:hypothetical protein GCM10022630_19290 [Thermobifida alba]